MKKSIFYSLMIVIISISLIVPVSCSRNKQETFFFMSEGSCWNIGFGSSEICIPQDSDKPLYIAGYHNGIEITGVLDQQRANAVWIDTGEAGIILIGIDCVGLSSGTIDKIRVALDDFCTETGCCSVNVYSTHDHAGVDTLGLWGPIAINGKSPEFMDELVSAAVSSAYQAYNLKKPGKLFFSSKETESMLRDSRDPQEFDSNIYQLRFSPEEDSCQGTRIIFYGAHAESLRGENTMISRDWPGAMSDIINQSTGDNTLFIPGAVGGLIMTSVQTEGDFDAVENMKLTGERLADTVLAVTPEDETELKPEIRLAFQSFDIRLDNTLFMYYKFLGILENPIKKNGVSYYITTKTGCLCLDGLCIALMPCEIFPELVSGNCLQETDPSPLKSIASNFGYETLIIAGLFNDELGYVVPPSVYVINDKLPYITEGTDGNGQKHYEETNSVGPEAANCISDSFTKCLELASK